MRRHATPVGVSLRRMVSVHLLSIKKPFAATTIPVEKIGSRLKYITVDVDPEWKRFILTEGV